MNGFKFISLVVLAITGIIITLEWSVNTKAWHGPALGGIVFLIILIALSIGNSKGGYKDGPKG